MVRSIARALKRQPAWAAGGALLAALLALFLLPVLAPSRASGRVLPRPNGLSPGALGAILSAQPGLEVDPRGSGFEVSASSLTHLQAGLAAFSKASSGALQAELTASLKSVEDSIRVLQAERTTLLTGPSDLAERLAALEAELRTEERELGAVSARLDRLAARIERNEASVTVRPVDTRESDALEVELSAARRSLAEARAHIPVDEARAAAAAARIEEVQSKLALARGRETLAARFAPIREMIEETRTLFARQQRLLDSVTWRRAELERLRPAGGSVPVSLLPDRGQAEARITSIASALRPLEEQRATLLSRLASTSTAADVLLPREASRPGWAWPALLLCPLLGGILAASARESLCGTVRTQHDLVRYVNLPVLGIFPQAPLPDPLRAPGGSLLEAYRTAASLLESKAKSDSLKLLAVTSPGVGEGKSTAAAGLAVTLARNGVRVLLVDADLRRPTQHERFGVTNESGLSTYLSGGVDSLDPLLAATELEPLVLLPSGPPLDNPPAYFRSERFQALCKDLRGWYDLAILDLPPVSAAAEALVAGAAADGTLLVLRAGTTGKDEITEAKRLLRGVGAKPWACALNRAVLKSRAYEYYAPPAGADAA